MRGPIPELLVGLGPDAGLPVVERERALQLTKAERRMAAQIRKLVEDLPKSGSVVIVHSPTVVSGLRQAIADLRGPDIAAATKVLSAPSLIDEEALTQGLSLPVLHAPLVIEQRQYRHALGQAWRV